MDIVQEAFTKLFQDREFNFSSSIKYSGHFKGYNANVTRRNNQLVFKLSKNWRGVSRDIQIGLIQELLLKILKQRHKKTLNMDLYNLFLKEVHIAVPKTKTTPILESSFHRINNSHFYGVIERPNLVWIDSTSKLGSYEYGTDTLSISRILESHEHLLDYVMYHELLHKKHKFKSSKTGNRHYHHTMEFKEDEKTYPNSEKLERQLSVLVSKSKIKNSFFKKKKQREKKPASRAKQMFLDLFGL